MISPPRWLMQRLMFVPDIQVCAREFMWLMWACRADQRCQPGYPGIQARLSSSCQELLRRAGPRGRAAPPLSLIHI
eukprot:14075671-Alexandrium_andersonii.AAC.1